MAEIADFPVPYTLQFPDTAWEEAWTLALACHRRIASPNAVFGHRGAALGLITGWGGTQRLPRLIGKGRALEMFVAAEKLTAKEAWQLGLVDAFPKIQSPKRSGSFTHGNWIRVYAALRRSARLVYRKKFVLIWPIATNRWP